MRITWYAAVAIALVAAGCADSHDAADAGDADARTEDAVVADAWVLDAGPDTPDAGPVDFQVRILVTEIADGTPVAAAPWRAIDSSGAITSGVADASGRALLNLRGASAPFDVEVVVAAGRFYLRDLRAEASARVHTGAPFLPGSDREVTVGIAGGLAGESVTVAGSNTYPGTRAAGPPPQVGFRWRDPVRPCSAAAFAYTPRFYVMEDLDIRLPDGSGTPRTMAVVARNAMLSDVPDAMSVDLSSGPSPRRAAMRIEVVGEGAWSPRGPVDRVQSAIPMDPQFTGDDSGGFVGSLALFDDAAAAPETFEIGPHDAQWVARLPAPVDFTIPRADRAPQILGSDVSSATVTSAAPAWSQILVRIEQRRADGTMARTRWVTRPSGAAIQLLPPGVDIETLGFERSGAEVTVRADTMQLLLSDVDLDIDPRHYIDSADLTTIVRLAAR